MIAVFAASRSQAELELCALPVDEWEYIDGAERECTCIDGVLFLPEWDENPLYKSPAVWWTIRSSARPSVWAVAVAAWTGMKA